MHYFTQRRSRVCKRSIYNLKLLLIAMLVDKTMAQNSGSRIIPKQRKDKRRNIVFKSQNDGFYLQAKLFSSKYCEIIVCVSINTILRTKSLEIKIHHKNQAVCSAKARTHKLRFLPQFMWDWPKYSFSYCPGCPPG